MVRIAVGLEYDGSAYAGWQVQTAAPSVQAAAERALSAVADHPVMLTCAGRTDAGVHALEQVAHFDTDAERSPRSWVLGANTYLPADICVHWAVTTTADFHARYSATARSYRYAILNRSSRPALTRQRVSWTPRPLEVENMAAAAQQLVGEHDFSAFRSAECQSRSPIRRLEALEVRRIGEHIFIDVRANAFLHHMVRNIAGVLMRIGSGEAPPAWARQVLEGRDRSLGGITAPAAGLYLMKVTYPRRFGLPEAATTGADGLSFIMPASQPAPGSAAEL